MSRRILTAAEKRETRFWPPITVALILGGYMLAGLIENGYMQ